MLHMYIQSNLFQFLYFTYNMENNGIQNNEYRRILKLKIHKKKQMIFDTAELVKVGNHTHIFYKYFILDADKKVWLTLA